MNCHLQKSYFRATFTPLVPAKIKLLLLLALVMARPTLSTAAPDLLEPIRVIRAVGLEGAGHVEASAAWRTLAATDAATLPFILTGMDGANDLAANWLRSAVETVATRALKSGGKLPQAGLQTFLAETKHDPRAAFASLEAVDSLLPLGRRSRAVEVLVLNAELVESTADQKEMLNELAKYQRSMLPFT